MVVAERERERRAQAAEHRRGRQANRAERLRRQFALLRSRRSVSRAVAAAERAGVGRQPRSCGMLWYWLVQMLMFCRMATTPRRTAAVGCGCAAQHSPCAREAAGDAADVDTMVAHRRLRRMMLFDGERPRPPKVREKE